MKKCKYREYVQGLYNGYIQYVHELQHAFKLFKVDDEIIIWQIK